MYTCHAHPFAFSQASITPKVSHSFPKLLSSLVRFFQDPSNQQHAHTCRAVLVVAASVSCALLSAASKLLRCSNTPYRLSQVCAAPLHLVRLSACYQLQSLSMQSQPALLAPAYSMHDHNTGISNRSEHRFNRASAPSLANDRPSAEQAC